LGAAASAPSGAEYILTAADAGKTVTLAVGGKMLVLLGNDHPWSVTVASPTILAAERGITMLPGAQEVLDALAPGTTTLRAIARPACRAGAHPCPTPSQSVLVRIVVR
jgi:hypothetical protein